MSGFFQSLLARSRGDSGAVRPRIASIFETPQGSDAAPPEETSVVEAFARPRRDSVEQPANRSIPSPAREIQAQEDAKPSVVHVEAVAAPSGRQRIPEKPAEPEIARNTWEPPRLSSLSPRIPSHMTSPASAAIEEPPASPATREIHETHELHETIREQRTLVDRTFFERVARAGKQSPPARPAAESSIRAEPEIHVSIGRIEVRAVNETPSTRKTRQQASPVMGLDEYLRHKSKGAAQ